MKASLTALMLLVPLALFSTGCVSQQHADELTAANRSLKEQVVSLQQQIEELQQRIKVLSGSDAATGGEIASLTRQRDTLQQQLDRLLRENEQLHLSRYSPALESALKEFAAKHSDFATYDPETGAVKLASDLTFALGSADLSANAAAALRQLAAILTSSLASQYEVRIVGHTDSVPVSRTATKVRFPNNWYLSTGRAISVRDALSSAGVPDVRTCVSGYAYYRPAAANTRRGTEANRRVEIYLVPMAPVNDEFLRATGSPGSATPTPAPAILPATPAPTPSTNEGPGELYK